jgi:hypothetical protein
MKKYLSGVFAFLLFLLNCSQNPTEPGASALKYISLTNSLMKEVEQFRGKNFKRNITTAVYTASQYRSIVAQDIPSPDDQASYNAILKRENLLRPAADYFAGYETLMSSMVGGYYVDGSDSIYIIKRDGAMRITQDDSLSIFHELIHALQDQYHDLTQLENNAQSSDRHYALRYVIEGEAELFTMYYSYKSYYGYYPATSAPIMGQFSYDQDVVDAYLDSLHHAGEPLFSYQPMLWGYYSYGPKFIDAIAGQNWQTIDNTIFAALPLRTAEVLHPARYSTANEYLLDLHRFSDALDSTQIVKDFDELGEMLTCVMFREWDFSTYRQIAQGLLVDNIIAYRGTQNDSLRLAWYTVWSGQVAATNFMSSYVQLVNKQRSIILPSPVQDSSRWIVNDTVNRVYIEQRDSSMFVLEDYPPRYLSNWISQLRWTKPYLKSGVAKAAADGRLHPYVDKGKFVKEIRKHGII